MPNKLDRLTALANNEWQPIHDKLTSFLATPIDPIPNVTPENLPGWQFFDTDSQSWVYGDYTAIGQVFTFDFEAKEVSPDFWMPTICCLYDGLWWYGTPEHEGDKTFKFPSNRIAIGQNSVAYDRRYMSCAYDLFDNTVHIDIMQLNNLMHGLADDDDSPLRSMWLKFDKSRRDGFVVPRWYDRGCPNDLKSMVAKFLGYEWAKRIDKSVRDSYQKDPTSVNASTLFEYCATDVEATQRLASIFYKCAFMGFLPNPITWLGMSDVNRSKYYLQDFQAFIDRSNKEYDEAIAKLTALRDSLLDDVNQQTFPHLDWTKPSRGKNKDKFRWQIDLGETSTFEKMTDIDLLQLTWQGKRIYHKRVGSQTVWHTEDGKLPHPTLLTHLNLGSPMVKDYDIYAEDGTLQSLVIDQETLIDIFKTRFSISQWEAYKTRYETMYFDTDSHGNTLCVADLNGCGTISRRATSKLWVLLPKPKKDKIGSDVMAHIGCPKGYSLVSADFVSQESRIFAAVVTDARFGEHGSNPWSKAILSGDKKQGTDAHSLTAKLIECDRNDGKTINFLAQYGGGVAQLTSVIRRAMKISEESSRHKAKDFINWLKLNDDAVAKSSFASLKYLSQQPHVRTYLLGAKMPDTLDVMYLHDPNAFMTTRNNWHIQSAGQDELHSLIFLIKLLAKKVGMECVFSCAVHDRAAFFVKDEHTHLADKVFNQAYDMLMGMSYEQAKLMWDKYDPRPDRKELQTPDNWHNFEKVYVAKNLLEK